MDTSKLAPWLTRISAITAFTMEAIQTAQATGKTNTEKLKDTLDSLDGYLSVLQLTPEQDKTKDVLMEAAKDIVAGQVDFMKVWNVMFQKKPTAPANIPPSVTTPPTPTPVSSETKKEIENNLLTWNAHLKDLKDPNRPVKDRESKIANTEARIRDANEKLVKM